METIGAIDFAVIAGYFILIFSIAAYVTNKEKSSDSAQGYFLGGRDLGWFAIGASLFASNIGSEHLIGLSGSGARGAFPEAQFEILASLILLLLGWVFVPFYLKSGVFTMPEFLERRYSTGARVYLSVVSIISYVLTKISFTIFAGALSAGDSYRDQIAQLAKAGTGAEEAVFAITSDDVRDGCDLFRGIYDATSGVDGRVSIEVSPLLAHDTEGTIAQARQLYAQVDRPNVYIKIPATPAGLPAITEVLASGISVNVTLIFSLERYKEVIDAFLAGIEAAAQRGHDVSQIHSVASFFVSRVDTAVDSALDAVGTDEARALRSSAGIANARLAYGVWLEAFATDRALALAAAGMNVQRPLWASTGVKDPALPQDLYVTELAAPHTVNTMPEKTLFATAETATIKGDRVTGFIDDAARVMDSIANLDISLAALTQALEDEGVEKFIASWHDLLGTVSAELDAASA
jgi:transaldolase